MAKMMMLIDPSRCTGCRGCQVACKQWNGLPATATTFTGSYQNPPDLNGDTYTLVRFQEYALDGFRVSWLMTNDKCRHCSEPTCTDMMQADMYYRSPEGAVVFNEKAKMAADEVASACPFNIPTQNKKTGLVVKCTLCVDRIADGLEPACAKTCPTDAIMWGDYDGMMKYAQDRIEWLKKTQKDRFDPAKVKLYPEASFACHVRWILLDTRERHGLNGDM